MRVKICGLTREDDVDAAIDAGADAVGLVLVPSPRCVTVRRARALRRHTGNRAACVAVFRTLTTDALTMALDAECTHLQALGSIDAFVALPGTISPLPVVVDDASAASRAAAFASLGLPIVFDSAAPGTGTLTSRRRAQTIARRTSIWLAGGLDPNNVADAIRFVRPLGVDVSSGVEREPGIKDHARMRAFVHAARAACLDSLEPEVLR